MERAKELFDEMKSSLSEFVEPDLGHYILLHGYDGVRITSYSSATPLDESEEIELVCAFSLQVGECQQKHGAGKPRFFRTGMRRVP